MFKSLKNIQNKIYIRNYRSSIPNICLKQLNEEANLADCKKLIAILNKINARNKLFTNLRIDNSKVEIKTSGIKLNNMIEYNNFKTIYISIETDKK